MGYHNVLRNATKCSKCGRLTRVKGLGHYTNVFGYSGPNGERLNAILCYECEAKLQLLSNLEDTCTGVRNYLRYRWDENKHVREKEEALTP